MAVEEVRGGVVPPKEHVGAPAHLLRTMGGLDVVAFWETDFDIGYALWWMPKYGRRVGPASASRQGFTYHAALYPPAAAQDAEGVRPWLIAQRKKVLWCCHVIGSDDVLAAPSYEGAVRMAADINAQFERIDPEDKNDILSLAIPALWPWSDEQHRSALAGAGEREGAK